MIRFSVVVPYYNGSDHIKGAVESVFSQSYDDFEVIVVDDRSPDWEDAFFREAPFSDPHVRIIRREENGGTLQARRDGVLAADGDYILFLDQDDLLGSGAMWGISSFLREETVDILHFPSAVISESEAASLAVAGMTSFVTPKPRSLTDSDILRYQFAEDDGFDFHVHHKAIRASLAKEAWGIVPTDLHLMMSDDLYMCFILDCIAKSYRAVSAPKDGPRWYEYHLGRGETLGASYDFKQYERFCATDAQAYDLLVRFVGENTGKIDRIDWDERLSDVRDRLVSHSMNEMADNLPFDSRSRAIEFALAVWAPDAVAGELYRYVRDRAYALLVSGEYPRKTDVLLDLVAQARSVDGLVGQQKSNRYCTMKETAERHLFDLRGIKPFFRKRLL